MVILKLTVIFAMLAGLAIYASVPSFSASRLPTRGHYDQLLTQAGYVKIEETVLPGDRVAETFELHVPTKPHYHQTTWFYLTCRGDQLVDMRHNESYADVPD